MFSKMLPAALAALRLPAVVAVTASFTLAAPAVAAQAAVDDEGPARLEKSILLVYADWAGYVYYPTEEGWTWSDEVKAGTRCTGWFASDDGHIVTAGHCVDPKRAREHLLARFLEEHNATNLLSDALANWKVEGAREGDEIRREIQVVQPEEVDEAVITSPLRAQVIDYRPLEEGDVALLRVANLDRSTPALDTAGERPRVGDPVTAIGFPGSVADVSDVSRLRASFKTGTVSSNQTSPQGVAGTEINADISGGMSGGPTVDENGRVLGVNSYTVVGEEQAFNFITSAEDLRAFLERNNVEFEAAAPAETTSPEATAPVPADRNQSQDLAVLDREPSGVPMAVWIIAGVAAAALIALAAFMLTRRRKTAGGAAAAGSTICHNCGRSNPPDTQFCGNCGSRLSASA